MLSVETIAELFGTSENGIRILLSLLFGYPLAFIYRKYLINKDPNIQHLFFTIFGIAICYFNFGFNVLHSIANILLIYILILTTGGSSFSVILAFLINMSYLCIGYYATMTNSYTIKWTTPHCVLTLRLIGLVFDIFDGKQKEEKLSLEQKETALAKTPNLLEICGHCYFFGGFLVGPQFPMKRYQDFVAGKFFQNQPNKIPDSLKPAMIRLLMGITYTLLFQVASIYFFDEYLTSSQFHKLALYKKCFYVLIWGKITLYKYVGCWLMTEGACILTGITYTGLDVKPSKDPWDGCANIKIRGYERANTCHQLVEAFNINTNKWMARYIFKRLKFLGNKDISHVATLAFLALWHGLYSGYFMNFFLEYVIMKFEKEIHDIMVSMKVMKMLNENLPGKIFLWIIRKIYMQFVLGYSLISFCLFTYDIYMPVYSSMYLIGHLFFIVIWPLFNLAYSISKKKKVPTATLR